MNAGLSPLHPDIPTASDYDRLIRSSAIEMSKGTAVAAPIFL